MSFVRTVKKENPFVQIDKGYIGNGELSLKATGLLTYFLSKPDNWQIRLVDVRRRFTDGETAVRSGLKELIEAGYVHRFRERDSNGRLGDFVYYVYGRPEYNPHFQPKSENHVQVNLGDSPKRDFPVQENPEQGNHLHSNIDFNNNDFNNNLEEEEEEGELNSLVNLFSKNITEAGKEAVKQNLSKWLKILPYDVIKLEIENCSLYGAKTWVYVEKALKESLDLKIVTIEDLKLKYDRHQEKSKGNKPSKGKAKTVRKENSPEWFEKHKKESEERAAATAAQGDEISEEEMKELLEWQQQQKKQARK